MTAMNWRIVRGVSHVLLINNDFDERGGILASLDKFSVFRACDLHMCKRKKHM